MSNKLSQEAINNQVWKACDTFRGTIDAGQYKDYILTMLFIKYITDVNREKREEYEKKYKGDAQRIERALKHERFVMPANSAFDFIYDKRNEANLGEIINIALENLEEANHAKLEKVFRNIDYNSEANLGQTKDRNRRLKNLLADFQELDLRPSNLAGNDVIGDAYEYLIGNFAAGAGKKAGEFYTASGVSKLLAKLVEPKEGNRICDPTCGSGSLLLKAAKEIGSKNVSLYGQEVNGSTYALARMNMFLHEMDNARIEWGDTINNPKLTENDALMKFDVVVANPPFSLDKWGAEDADADKYQRFHRGVPPKSKGDYAFITHMIETLNEHGRAGVVLPHGVLFRGSSEGKIRKKL
ncbi:MAG: type I restriction enzyme M protein, partial [Arcticibacterium sp.]